MITAQIRPPVGIVLIEKLRLFNLSIHAQSMIQTPKYFALNSTWRYVRDESGLDLQTISERLNMDLNTLRQDTVYLTSKQHFALWELWSEHVGVQTAVFAITDRIIKGRFESVFYAGVCSHDLRTGMRRLAQTKELIYPKRVPVHEDAKGLTIGIDWYCPPSEAPDGLDLIQLFSFIALARFATGKEIVPDEFCLHRLPSDPKPYERWLGTTINQAKESFVRFKSADLDCLFVTSDLEILKLLDENFANRLRARNEDPKLSSQVSHHIRKHLASGQFDIASTAKALGHSTRDLQRKLKELNTSYQNILFQTRAELAATYLDKELSVNEIVLLLGFEEVTSLRRLLKKAKLRPSRPA